VAVVRAGALFGLFWEQYAPAPTDGATRTIAITATRIGTTAWERLGAMVGRAVVAQPVSLRYADPTPAGAPPGRYVALRWPVVPPGTYRLSVTVADAPAPGVVAGAPGPRASGADRAGGRRAGQRRGRRRPGRQRHSRHDRRGAHAPGRHRSG
jgi:hypothetical protein